MTATNDDINKLKRWACGPHAATIIDVCDELMRLRTAALVDKRLTKPVDKRLTKPSSRGGRPSTTGKPWIAAGISRQAWYKRNKKIA